MADKLTDLKIKNMKPKEKSYKVNDPASFNLYVEVSPKGLKTFRFRYRHKDTKKEQVLTIGRYPEFSLSDAREAAANARKQLAHGTDPVEYKKETKLQAKAESITFNNVAEEWLGKRQLEWSKIHYKDTKQKLGAYVLPCIIKLI